MAQTEHLGSRCQIQRVLGLWTRGRPLQSIQMCTITRCTTRTTTKELDTRTPEMELHGVRDWDPDDAPWFCNQPADKNT